MISSYEFLEEGASSLVVRNLCKQFIRFIESLAAHLSTHNGNVLNSDRSEVLVLFMTSLNK